MRRLLAALCRRRPVEPVVPEYLSDILGALESIERILIDIRDDVAKDRAS